MQEFTIFDGGVAAVLLISAVLAYSRGLLREALAIAGWIVAAVGAFLLAPQATPFMHEIPYVSDMIGTSCELAILAAFLVVFVLVLVVLAILTPVLAGTVRESALGEIDRGLGVLFGVARGLLLILVVLIVHDRIVPEGDGIEAVENSFSKQLLAGSQAGLEGLIPDDAPSWIINRYEDLMGSCGPAQDAAPDAEVPESGSQDDAAPEGTDA